MTKETRAVLRSRRGEEISLFSAISAAVRVAASTFGRGMALSGRGSRRADP